MTTVHIAGLGSIGLRHAQNFMDLGCEILGYDLSEERCRSFAEKGGQVIDPATGMERADLVVIATPTHLHLEPWEMAIDAGCHVLVEKPLAHDVGRAQALCMRAEEKGVLVFPALNLRFLPAVQAASHYLSEGRLGEILWARFLCASYLPSYRPGTDYRAGYAANPIGGGVLFDIIHEFDLANYLLGTAEVIAAHARNSQTLDIPTEDCADVLLRHENRVVSSLHLDFVTRPKMRITEIAGTQGVLKLNVSERNLMVLDTQGQVTLETSWDEPYADCYVNEAAAALSAMKGESTFPVSWRESLSVLSQVVEARRFSGIDEQN